MNSPKAKRLLELRSTFALIWASAEVTSNSILGGGWLDTASKDEDDEYGQDAVATAVEYINLINRLEMDPIMPALVRLRGIPNPIPFSTRH